MSVLVVEPYGELAEQLVRRLVGEGDEVRVVEADPERAAAWAELGAYVARGRPDDQDFVERACQNVRTVVVLDDPPSFDALVDGAVAAGVDRFVWLARRGRPELARLRAIGLDYVVIAVPRASWRRRPGFSAAAVAEAIDAADDLAGNPRLEVDLGDASGWKRLGLEMPG